MRHRVCSAVAIPPRSAFNFTRPGDLRVRISLAHLVRDKSSSRRKSVYQKPFPRMCAIYLSFVLILNEFKQTETDKDCTSACYRLSRFSVGSQRQFIPHSVPKHRRCQFHRGTIHQSKILVQKPPAPSIFVSHRVSSDSAGLPRIASRLAFGPLVQSAHFARNSTRL